MENKWLAMEMWFHTGCFYIKVFRVTPQHVLFLSQCRQHTVFLKVVNLLLLILQHNWMHKVKICYISLKSNASKLYKGYERYDYVGYVAARLIQ